MKQIYHDFSLVVLLVLFNCCMQLFYDQQAERYIRHKAFEMCVNMFVVQSNVRASKINPHNSLKNIYLHCYSSFRTNTSTNKKYIYITIIL